MNARLFLLSLLRASAPPADQHAQLMARVAWAPLASTLAAFASAKTIDDVQALAQASASGTLSAEAVLPTIDRLANSLDQEATSRPKDAQQIDQLAESLLALAAVLHGTVGEQRPILQLSLEPERSRLIKLVPEWYMRTAPDTVATIVIFQQRGVVTEHVIQPQGHSYSERRVVLRYRADHDCPILDMRALATTVADEQPDVRTPWLQHPSADYDLIVYTEQERRKGRIATRLHQGPRLIKNETLALIIAPASDGNLLCTEIFDEWDRPRLRVFRYLWDEAAVQAT